jgi:hypothetical protein
MYHGLCGSALKIKIKKPTLVKGWAGLVGGKN